MFDPIAYQEAKIDSLKTLLFKAGVDRDVNSNSCLRRPWLYKKADAEIKQLNRQIRRRTKIIKEFMKNEKSLQR